MLIEIKVPTPGESITEVELGKWLVVDGEFVVKDQEVAEIESDKATLTLSATESGQVKILISEGDRVAVGAIACTIDTAVSVENKPVKEAIVSDLFTKAEEVIISAPEKESIPSVSVKSEESNVKITPVAREMMEEYNLSIEDVLNGLQRISKGDIEAVLALPKQEQSIVPVAQMSFSRVEKREKMTSLRRKK